MRSLLKLDHRALSAAFARRGAKQWLIAQQLGVHPRTVSRWLQGRVSSIDADSAERLAAALDCAADELLLHDALPPPSNEAIRQAAAQAITQADLIALVSPSGNWALAEKLIRATLEPGLPGPQAGRLLNALSIACWRQARYGEAREAAQQAERQGAEASCPPVVAKARFNLATLDSFAGRYFDSIRLLEQCAACPADFDSPRDYGSALANLSMSLREVGRLGEALTRIDAATAIFRVGRWDFNSAIACSQRALILGELGRFKPALDCARRGIRIAQKIGDSGKAQQLGINAAELLALLGDPEAGLAALEPCLPWLQSAAHYDGELFIKAARIMRLAGDLLAARQLMDAGADQLRRPAHLRGLALQEGARIAFAAGDSATAATAASCAKRVFRDAGLLLRIWRGPLPEYGSQFAGSA